MADTETRPNAEVTGCRHIYVKDQGVDEARRTIHVTVTRYTGQDAAAEVREGIKENVGDARSGATALTGVGDQAAMTESTAATGAGNVLVLVKIEESGDLSRLPGMPAEGLGAVLTDVVKDLKQDYGS